MIAGYTYTSTMTITELVGEPYGSCGVPRNELVDDDGKLLPFISISSAGQNIFMDGANCGRWVEIKIGNVCSNSNDLSPAILDKCLSNAGA